jgi:hypothetical protein
MSGEAGGDAFDRVAREAGGTEVVDRLAALSGSDFTTVMLEVARRRAGRETPATVLRRYQRDRFVRPGPGPGPWRAARRAEDVLLGVRRPGMTSRRISPAAHSAGPYPRPQFPLNRIYTALRERKEYLPGQLSSLLFGH